MPESKSVLTDDEWGQAQIESFYGISQTSLQVDHNGRLFATASATGRFDDVVILNEGRDAEIVLPKVIALCLLRLDDYVASLRRLCDGKGTADDADRVRSLLLPAD